LTHFEQEITRKLATQIKNCSGKSLKIMEVCGSHTVAIGKYGIKNILPKSIKLVSGPGCPVCLTDNGFIDTAVEISLKKEVILCTFGDLIRVKGINFDLSQADNVRIVISPVECLKIAKENPSKEVIFLSIGFETTTPITALVIQKAYADNIKNFSILVANKTMPSILEYLCTDPDFNIDGFIFPGNVCVISGCEFYRKFCEKNSVKGVIAGFDIYDILGGISFVANNINDYFCNNYRRFAKDEGNIQAQSIVSEVFEKSISFIKAIGFINDAGLRLKEKYAFFDAEKRFEIPIKNGNLNTDCQCGNIIKGKTEPKACPLFGKFCNPSNPAGSCMISEEGPCMSAFKYEY